MAVLVAAIKMRKVTIITITLLLLWGCALPIPHRRLHEFGVKGSLLDKETQLPISDAIVFSLSDNDEFVTSNKNGYFSLSPLYGWHGGYFIGPINLSFWPGFDMPAPVRDFIVYAPEYRVKRISINQDYPEGNYLVQNSIELDKENCTKELDE